MVKIYLDYAATTPVLPEVVKEMSKFFNEEYGNPGSLHALGENALKSINKAREKFAKEINAKNSEIIFTSGATEGNNIVLKNLSSKKNKIIISSIEHPSVYETAEDERKKGCEIVKLSVDKFGVLNFSELEKKIDKDTLLVSVMHVNNIMGSVQDLEKIGKICKKKGVLFHTDAVQSFGKLKIDVRKMNIDMLSASAHKIGGPKGVGFLYVREGIKLKPLFFGGGQEKDIRSGTENVPGIMGFAKALEIIKKNNRGKIKKLRVKLIEELKLIGGKINSPDDGIFGIVHVSFSGINSENLVYRLSREGIYVSVGSACDNKREKEDYILKAIGLNLKEIKGAIRISFSENLNEKQIKLIISKIKAAVREIRV